MEFIVKNGESALEFFTQHALQKPKEGNFDPFIGEGPNVYYLMRDEILIKNSGEINVGDVVKFELPDRSISTGKPLKNKYVYEVQEHDSVCVKLHLVGFEIVTEQSIFPS